MRPIACVGEHGRQAARLAPSPARLRAAPLSVRSVLEPKSAGTAPGRPHLLPGNFCNTYFAGAVLQGGHPQALTASLPTPRSIPDG